MAKIWFQKFYAHNDLVLLGYPWLAWHQLKLTGITWNSHHPRAWISKFRPSGCSITGVNVLSSLLSTPYDLFVHSFTPSSDGLQRSTYSMGILRINLQILGRRGFHILLTHTSIYPNIHLWHESKYRSFSSCVAPYDLLVIKLGYFCLAGPASWL